MKTRQERGLLTTTGRILKIAVATLGLISWAVFFLTTLVGSPYDVVPGQLNNSPFENPLDFMIKISALFLLFPLVFNLLVLCGGRLLDRRWKDLLLNFIHAVIYEFGLFWGIFVLGYLFLY